MRELNDEESEEESEDESGDEAEDSRNQTTVSSQDQSQGSVLSVQNRSHSQVFIIRGYSFFEQIYSQCAE